MKARLAPLDRLMAELDGACRRLLEATLRAAGYRKSKSYEWRRSMTTEQRPRDAAESDEHDPASDAARREALDLAPGGWHLAGDLAAHAEASWIDLIAGDDEVFREALHLKAADLRFRVAGPDPSPLEELLARRVVATWLQASHADASYARLRDVSLRQAEFALKRMNAAHRRHTQAIAAMAVVRRLLAAAPAGVSRAPLKVVGDRAEADGGVAGRTTKRSAS